MKRLEVQAYCVRPYPTNITYSAQTTDPVPIYYTCIFLLDPGPTGGLPVSRSGPQRNKQRFPDEDRISTGHSVQHQHHGAPPLRPVCDDSEQRKQQHLPGTEDAINLASDLHIRTEVITSLPLTPLGESVKARILNAS